MILTNNLAQFSVLSSSYDTKWEIPGIFRGALLKYAVLLPLKTVGLRLPVHTRLALITLIIVALIKPTGLRLTRGSNPGLSRAEIAGTSMIFGVLPGPNHDGKLGSEFVPSPL
jgi:hypothetical protein